MNGLRLASVGVAAALSVTPGLQQLPFNAPPERRGEPFLRQLTVFDRTGSVVRTLGEPDFYDQPTLSPDGTQVGAFVDGAIQVFDVSTGESRRVTSSARGYPVWSPDGSQLVFSLKQEDRRGLHRIASSGRGEDELLYQHQFGVDLLLTDWSPDGRFLAFSAGEVPWVVPVGAGRAEPGGLRPQATELLREEFGVWGLRFSPDGHYVAYVSDESGRHEVYARVFDPSLGLGAEKWQVSSQGGRGLVQWRSDGRELYYVAPDGWVMAVDVATTPVFRAGQPRPLFRAPPTFELEGVYPDEGTNGPACVCGDGCEQGGISRNGQRFVFAVPLPPEREEIEVRPDVLARYAGTYGVDGIEWVVSLEGDRLMIQTTLGKKAPLSAESETRFFLKATNLDLEFATDDVGVVTSLFMHRGRAPRVAIRR